MTGHLGEGSVKVTSKTSAAREKQQAETLLPEALQVCLLIPDLQRHSICNLASFNEPCFDVHQGTPHPYLQEAYLTMLHSPAFHRCDITPLCLTSISSPLEGCRAEKQPLDNRIARLMVSPLQLPITFLLLLWTLAEICGKWRQNRLMSLHVSELLQGRLPCLASLTSAMQSR